jgi:hypothetical protein
MPEQLVVRHWVATTPEEVWQERTCGVESGE